MKRTFALAFALALLIELCCCTSFAWPPVVAPTVRSEILAESDTGSLHRRDAIIPPPTAASASCAVFRDCKRDVNFQTEVAGFLNFAASRYPDANVPRNDELLKYACRVLDDGDGKRPNLQYDNRDSPKRIRLSMNDWFAMFLHHSYWTTELGSLPYRNPVRPPMWWCFLAPDAVYNAGSTYYVYGGANIVLSFAGLGIDTQGYLQGAGLYVSKVNLTDIYPINSPRADYAYSFSFCNKELVNTNFSPFVPRGTVKPIDTYGLFMIIKEGKISKIIEFINEIPTLLWAGYVIGVPQ